MSDNGEPRTELDRLIERVEGLYQDLELTAVKRWKSEHPGAPAIGFLPIYVPREIVDAAGGLSVGLMGASNIEIIRGDAYFQSYICHLPRSMVELAESGRLDCLDGFLFPSICDVVRNLSGMWKLLFKDKYVRYFDVPQNYDPAVGGRFYEGELRRLLADVSALAGRTVTDDDLRVSIQRYNRNRQAMESLYRLRAEAPWKAQAWEAYLIARAWNLMPPDEHTALVEHYISLATASDRSMRDQTPVVVTGAFCEQPPLGLLKTLERAGCYIVWDDLVLGARWIRGDVETGGDPIHNLSEAFLHRSVDNASRYIADAEKGQMLLEVVKNTGAQGVVFCAPSFCDPSLLEQPMLQAALDRAGVPHVAFKYSENLGQFQVIREQAGTFADAIRLWSDA